MGVNMLEAHSRGVSNTLENCNAFEGVFFYCHENKFHIKSLYLNIMNRKFGQSTSMQ
uniref:Uncharacterized protein n=1 Tax=Anguilla anguilla TaxID=7936 RepID=A0A0E9Y096_ANGAN